jgi:ABC-type uncharacterized transport system permease subunit
LSKFKLNETTIGWLTRLGALVLVFIFTAILLLSSNVDPIKGLSLIFEGAVGSWDRVLNTWTPLLLATLGVLVTFTTGLWNIGVEGQIMLGAIFVTGALRMLEPSGLPSGVILLLAILAGGIGGMLWAFLTGLLKVYGGVNEIFGGLGLNFLALAVSNWLIYGPWSPPGVANGRTALFDSSLWLPNIPGTNLSLYALVIGIVAAVLIYFLLKGTYYGLKLKAVGKNAQAARLLGIPTSRYMLSAFLLCGFLAGLGGAMRVVTQEHQLTSMISAGYGFLGLLVGMLVNYNVIGAALVAIFFVSLQVGKAKFEIVMQIQNPGIVLDSSFTGVLQAMLVFLFLFMEGVRNRLLRKR